MKLWTGDEWRPLSENEAKYRLDNGFIVLEDSDPRTKINAPPAAKPKTKGTAGERVVVETPAQQAEREKQAGGGE